MYRSAILYKSGNRIAMYTQKTADAAALAKLLLLS
ncbi:hypothetical protein SAMN05421740_112144 [Parapedobacter koreensis]|uniref:Uncharacterized protein n=1 Tax=Parapedobacter koreensis TaxID=332977 RepID=A0A1H7TWS6_9SPHI|nr:hypothetical protein SAMN05421740_112144 [Parapedobacter koreensis]